ncbi:hypothetical protein ACIP80_33090 [Streptomyces sp. NPDC088555]|uniref:DNA polymerase III subunit beta family protein n=1 Tax=Streptomyces sp. NPDC088555 TaxID=3365866 RepID=UPI0038281210
MSVTINAHQLGRLIARTSDHISDDDRTPALHGIRLEADTEYLYAAATDRYTLAAARYRHHSPDNQHNDAEAVVPFARTLPTAALPALREWISAAPGHDPVTVTPTGDRLRFTTANGEINISVNPDAEFVDWRGLLRGVIEQTPDTGSPVPVFPAFDTRLQARWQSADTVVRFRVTGDQQALLVAGEDFLGAQMPCRACHDSDTLTTLDDVCATWDGVLSASPAVTSRAALPVPARSRLEAPSTVGETTEELLRQTLRSTAHMIEADSELFAAHAIAGVTAWAAYRYLDALHTADPHLAAAVVAETAGQLDDGAIGEWAWDAAVAAGYNPQKWMAGLEEALAPQLAPGDRQADEGFKACLKQRAEQN